MDTLHAHTLTLLDGADRLSLPCATTSTLLEAMGQAGLPVRQACRNGVCGLCRCRLREGEITYHWKRPHGLWQKDQEAGLILPCIAYPVTDLVLDQLTTQADSRE